MARVYAVGMITITDRTRYDRYKHAFMPVLQAFGGTLLAADEAPAVEEGEWPHQKLVLLSFDDEAQYRRWKDSPDYRQIARDRHAGAHGTVILVHGLNDERRS